MLNPMTDWEPGTLVRYHGSITILHGTCTTYRPDSLLLVIPRDLATL